MSARKLKVVLTRRLPDAVETRMRELFDAELNLTDRPMSRAELAAALQRAEVLAPTITDHLDAELIAGAGEQLKMIEDQLLAESTLADLKKAAAREAKEGKPAQ